MKKSNLKVICGTVAGFILGGVTVVGANQAIQAIQNTHIKVNLNGAVQEFKDETTGEVQYPITYHDRTYLPLRNVAQLSGLKVDYDAKKDMAILNNKDNKISFEFEKEKVIKINNSDDAMFSRITYSREVPIVKYSDDAVAQKMQKTLREINDKYWKEAVGSAYDTAESDEIGLKYNYTDSSLIDDYLSIQLYQNGGMGGVSWLESEWTVFDLNTGEQVSIKDLLKDEEGFVNAVVDYFKKEVNDTYQEYLKKYPDHELYNPDATTNGSYAEWNYGLSDGWEKNLREEILVDGNWHFEHSAIEFCLPKYSIGAGAMGTPIIIIPNKVINPYLKTPLNSTAYTNDELLKLTKDWMKLNEWYYYDNCTEEVKDINDDYVSIKFMYDTYYSFEINRHTGTGYEKSEGNYTEVDLIGRIF